MQKTKTECEKCELSSFPMLENVSNPDYNGINRIENSFDKFVKAVGSSKKQE
jgi:hypothetical protein